MNSEQFRNAQWQQIDPQPDIEAAEKLDTKKFWFIWVPLGAIIGLFACILGGSGGLFLPVWAVSTFVLWAATSK